MVDTTTQTLGDLDSSVKKPQPGVFRPNEASAPKKPSISPFHQIRTSGGGIKSPFHTGRRISVGREVNSLAVKKTPEYRAVEQKTEMLGRLAKIQAVFGSHQNDPAFKAFEKSPWKTFEALTKFLLKADETANLSGINTILNRFETFIAPYQEDEANREIEALLKQAEEFSNVEPNASALEEVPKVFTIGQVMYLYYTPTNEWCNWEIVGIFTEGEEDAVTSISLKKLDGTDIESERVLIVEEMLRELLGESLVEIKQVEEVMAEPDAVEKNFSATNTEAAVGLVENKKEDLDALLDLWPEVISVQINERGESFWASKKNPKNVITLEDNERWSKEKMEGEAVFGDYHTFMTEGRATEREQKMKDYYSVVDAKNRYVMSLLSTNLDNAEVARGSFAQELRSAKEDWNKKKGAGVLLEKRREYYDVLDTRFEELLKNSSLIKEKLAGLGSAQEVKNIERLEKRITTMGGKLYQALQDADGAADDDALDLFKETIVTLENELVRVNDRYIEKKGVDFLEGLELSTNVVPGISVRREDLSPEEQAEVSQTQPVEVAPVPEAKPDLDPVKRADATEKLLGTINSLAEKDDKHLAWVKLLSPTLNSQIRVPNDFLKKGEVSEPAPRTWRDILVETTSERNPIDLKQFAEDLTAMRIVDFVTHYVPSYVKPNNPDSLVNFLGLIGYDVLNRPDLGVEFKGDERVEISNFVDALQVISQSIDRAKVYGQQQ